MDEIIQERLEQGAEVNLPYGKLMERLLTIKMLRENISFKRSYRWDRGGDAEVVRNVDTSKAVFYKDLIPMAEKKLRDIR